MSAIRGASTVRAPAPKSTATPRQPGATVARIRTISFAAWSFPPSLSCLGCRPDRPAATPRGRLLHRDEDILSFFASSAVVVAALPGGDAVQRDRLWENPAVRLSSKLPVLSAVIALGAIAAYAILLRVPAVRNHPEGYLIAFAVATALAVVAVRRARRRRWAAWLAFGFSSLLLLAGTWFNFVAARVPDTPTSLRVGERAPDFTLTDAAGRQVSLADYRGKKPVILVFYRGYW
jgi:hypothetical protein